MNPQDSIDFGRDAIRACFMIGGPILAASLLIGLIVSVLQALTQVQDQTVSFVPKLLGVLLVIGLCLPWFSDQMVDYSRQTLSQPMMPGLAVTEVRETESKIHTASHFQQSESSSSFQLPSTQNKPESQTEPSIRQSPFQLPHYRYSKVPKTNIDG